MNKRLVIVSILALTIGLVSSGCKKRVPPQETYTQPTTPDTTQTDDSAAKQPLDTGLAAFKLNDVHYDFDSAELSTEAREILARNAQYLSEHPEATLIIEGHCDERGSTEYNLALGQRRAESAKRYLASLGVSDSRLKTVSYGEERPVASGHDENAWWQNRRGHFNPEQ